MPRALVGLSVGVPLRDEVHILRARLEAVQTLDAASGVAGLVLAANKLLDKPVAFIDAQGRTVSAAPRSTSAWPGLDALRQVETAAAPVILPAGRAGAPGRRHLVHSGVGEGAERGWVVVQERGRILTEFDAVVLDLLGTRLARELRTHRRIAALAADARSHLTRQLIRGTADRSDLRATGEHLGVDVDVHRIPVVLLAPESSTIALDPAEWERELSTRLSVEVLSTRGSEGLLFLVEAPLNSPAPHQTSAVRQAIHAVVATAGDSGLAVGIGTRVAPESLGAAYREAREVALSARHSGHGRSILTVDDLGPLRPLLAHLDPVALRQHAEARLGPLFGAGQGELVRTLDVWFDNDQRIRATAQELGVHENTVRLRLERVHDLTGIDPHRSAGQLDLHLCLLIRRLLGASHRTAGHWGEERSEA